MDILDGLNPWFWFSMRLSEIELVSIRIEFAFRTFLAKAFGKILDDELLLYYWIGLIRNLKGQISVIKYYTCNIITFKKIIFAQ